MNKFRILLKSAIVVLGSVTSSVLFNNFLYGARIGAPDFYVLIGSGVVMLITIFFLYILINGWGDLW